MTVDLDHAELLTHASQAAETAGRMLKDLFGRATVNSREGRDIKLDEDRIAQDLIVAHLSRTTSLPMLTEEAGWIGGEPAGNGAYWLIDPLDGSYNFAAGIPLCCVSIALCRGMTPVLGCTHDFLRGETYSGGAGLGLSINNQAVAPTPPRRDILASGFPSSGNQAVSDLAFALRDWRKMRMLGTAALSLSWVAVGRLDGYREDGIRWWDVAAGLALIDSIGGRYTVSSAETEQDAARSAGPLDRLLVMADRGILA